MKEFTKSFERIKAPFTRDLIKMGSDEGRLHRIGSRIVGIYTGSDPFGFCELLTAL